MKKLLTFCCAFIASVLFFSNSNAQTPYWTEGFEDTLFVSSDPYPNTPKEVTVENSGTWIQYCTYRTKSLTGNPVGTFDIRMEKPSTIVSKGGAGFGYLISPVFTDGVGTVTYYEGRGARAITIEKSTDSGTTWTLVEVDSTAPALPKMNTVTVNDAAANRLRFSNQGKSDADLDEVTITNYTETAVENEKVTPLRFDLDQNYPNPFNPSTKISFSLDKSSNVKLSVFNMIGQEVAVLINKDMNAGSHEVSFNASMLPSGIYFYCLTTGTRTITKKMTLLK